MAESIQRLPVVKARTGYSRSSIYALVAQSKFPPLISLGPRAIGWVSSEIDGWIADQIEKSRVMPRARGPLSKPTDEQ
jgi:prophage regulatory protein